MAFVITDGNDNYIDDHFKLVKGFVNARDFGNELKASKCLMRNISSSKSWYNDLGVVYVHEEQQSSEVESSYEVEENIVRDLGAFDSPEVSVDDFVNDLRIIFSTKLNDDYVKYLRNKISESDMKVVDLQHAIEFNVANVVGGYRYYKMLHDVLVQRRRYKNELNKINILMDLLDKSKVESALTSIGIIDSQCYKPRLLEDLFK